MKLIAIVLGICLISQFILVDACLFNSACSGHGVCSNFVCVCNPGWVGDDCSIQLVPISSGQSVTQTLEDRSWIYYDIATTSADRTLTFTVSQNNILSDCDLYIQFDSFPSKSDFYKKDSSRDLNFEIKIDNPGEHLWYAGMFGFYGCSYTLTVTVENQPNCPNQCSGNGLCQLNDTCICNTGYTGNDCSTAIIPLQSGYPITNHINQFAWQYFYYNSVQDLSGSIPSFTVTVNQTNVGEGDSDLYIKYEGLPSLFTYDYRQATIVENYSLTVGSPKVGVYYIGIYGYRGCTYTVTLNVQHVSNCEDRCSAHGTCSNDVCRCIGPFNGTKCETMTSALEDGISVNGYVENNQWNYYFTDTQTSNNIVISMQQTGGGDCDVYIKANANPTKTSFDYRDIGFSTNFNITILNPLGSSWFIGVYGYRSCEYTITERVSKNSCPNNCSGNGQCTSGGRCSCNSGFAGDDCSSPLYRIQSGALVSGTVSNNNWVYYKYTAPSTKSSITVTLLESDSAGYLWLYLSHAAPPSQLQYDILEDSQTASHIIHELVDNTNSNSDYYIGVYGSPFLPLTIQADFQIVVYSPAI